ncbi:MAG: SGNH/GDSL hydrolase family protein [Deltaproteobacteria bacterium]|nr:SGNH/GDSL hydrolase family protein [Deltaproteobacteria bacterium]
MKTQFQLGLLILSGIFTGLGTGELILRIHPLQPRTQIVRQGTLRLSGGVPVWEEQPAVVHRECVEQHPERIRILFVGSSITYGSGKLDEFTSFTALLEDRLNALRPAPGFCVLNFAQPGFGFEQKWAMAREQVPIYHPAVTLLEHWDGQWYHYSLLGDAAYATRGMTLRADGFPGMPCVPDFLNQYLFLHSRLYQYTVIALAHDDGSGPESPRRFVRDTLAGVAPTLRVMGTRPVYYMATTLDRPFADRRPVQENWQDPIRQLGQVEGVPVYSLAEELKDSDYLDLRQDSCCHFNLAGHEALAKVFERIVLKELDHPSKPGVSQRTLGRTNLEAGIGKFVKQANGCPWENHSAVGVHAATSRAVCVPRR